MISIYLVKLGIEVHFDAKWRIEILEQGMLHIFLGKQRFVCGDLPINAQTVIEDADASVGLWGVEVITLVLEDYFICKNNKTMSETSRDEELTVIIFCKFNCDILTEGWRAFANINSDIENCTFNHSN